MSAWMVRPTRSVGSSPPAARPARQRHRRIITRCRIPPDSWCGTHPGARGGMPTWVNRLRRPLLGAAPGHPLVPVQHLTDLPPHVANRVQPRSSAPGRRTRSPAHAPSSTPAAHQLPTVQPHRPWTEALPGNRPVRAERGHALAHPDPPPGPTTERGATVNEAVSTRRTGPSSVRNRTAGSATASKRGHRFSFGVQGIPQPVAEQVQARVSTTITTPGNTGHPRPVVVELLRVGQHHAE